MLHIAVGREPALDDLHSDSVCGFSLLLEGEAAVLPECDTLAVSTRGVRLFLLNATAFLPAVKTTLILGSPSLLRFV